MKSDNTLDESGIDKVFDKCLTEIVDTINTERMDEVPVNLTIFYQTKDGEMGSARLVAHQLVGNEDDANEVFKAVGNSFYGMTGESIPLFICISREAWVNKAVNMFGDELKFKEAILVSGQTYDFHTRSAIILVERREDNSLSVGKVTKYSQNIYGSGYTEDPQAKYIEFKEDKLLTSFFQGVADAITGVHQYDNVDYTKIEGHIVGDNAGTLSNALKKTKEILNDIEDYEDKDRPDFGKN